MEEAETTTTTATTTSSSTSTSTIVDFRRPRSLSPEKKKKQQKKENWLDEEISRLAAVVSELRSKSEEGAEEGKEERALAHLLGADSGVAAFLATAEGRALRGIIDSLPAEDSVLLWTLPAIGQGHVLVSTLLPESEEEEEDNHNEEEKDASSLSSSSLDDAPSLAVVSSRLTRLAGGTLRPIDRFYGPIGGLAGYQLACLRLLRAGNAAREGAAEKEPRMHSSTSSSSSSTSTSTSSSLSSSPAALPGARISPPPGPDLSDEREAASARAHGLRFLPKTAEIVPLGGAGDRLGLSCDSTGEALPAALLPYAGRSLLEGIVRDLQAREYLHWRAFGGDGNGGEEDGTQEPTRVALMTSCAKGGDRRVKRLLERSQWFGRGASSFKVFCQPQVPLVSAGDGRWLASGAGVVERRPGGHGALWKVLADGGAFGWLRQSGATAAVVRQINNPLAGTDGTLLALAGEGAARGAAFGFACCPRRPGAAEGAVVLLELPEQKSSSSPSPSSPSSPSPSPSPSPSFSAATATTTAHVTCVEYTEFEAAGLCGEELEALPANSNLLFVDLAAAEAAVAGSPSPSPSFSPSPTSAASSSASAFSVGRSALEDAVASLASGALPGVVFNSSKEVEWRDVSSSNGGGEAATTTRATTTRNERQQQQQQQPLSSFKTRKEPAGRLESTMQNLVDHMPAARARIECSGGAGASEKEEERHFAEEAFASDASAAAAAAAATAAAAAAAASSSCSSQAHLPTFALRGPRRRITSSAKRARKPGGPAAQTPEGSFLDLCRNAADLLALCGVALPLEVVSKKESESSSSSSSLAFGDAVDAEAFLAGRPPFLFLFHPALGPTWDVISQKIRGGKLAEGSELVLEVAEARIVDLKVRGSLLISADNPLGHWTSASPNSDSPVLESERLVYSSRNGRVRLEGVEVDNAGVEWGNAKNVLWRHLLSRKETAKFRLRGRSELDARGVTLRGDVSFEVPDGKRLVLRPKVDGTGRSDVEATLEDLDDEVSSKKPSWEWRVSERGGGDSLPGLDLTLVEN